jgi:predicted enzyme related to lactoylglutathione lyase
VHTFAALIILKLKSTEMKKLVSWIDIPAADFQRAVKFYSTVLQTELHEFDCGTEKMACFPSGEGAISFAPGLNPSTDGVLVSLNTGNDLGNTIVRVTENGGTIVQPKTKIEVEGRGYFALFTDSEGNRMGLYGDV